MYKKNSAGACRAKSNVIPAMDAGILDERLSGRAR